MLSLSPHRFRLGPLLAALAVSLMPCLAVADDPFQGIVVEVIDGHSIVVEKKSGKTGKPEPVEIRLIGIYAPETYPAPDRQRTAQRTVGETGPGSAVGMAARTSAAGRQKEKLATTECFYIF